MNENARGRLPTFLVIGAHKAGTTSLWAYLRSHRQVFTPDMKEPGFFAEEVRWHLGLSWYRSLFAGATDQIALGEASTFYTMYPMSAGVPERIASVVPDVRLIYMVRDPIERMRSAYVHNLWDGTERRPISRALLDDPRYIAFSRYATQLDRYLEWFSESQILVLSTEDLRDKRAPTLARAMSFLGVDPTFPLDSDRYLNTSEGKRALRASGRAIKSISRNRLLPSRLARRVARMRTWPIASRGIRSEELIVAPETRRRLLDQLAPDLEGLKRWMGPGYDGWGFFTEDRQEPAR